MNIWARLSRDLVCNMFSCSLSRKKTILGKILHNKIALSITCLHLNNIWSVIHWNQYHITKVCGLPFCEVKAVSRRLHIINWLCIRMIGRNGYRYLYQRHPLEGSFPHYKYIKLIIFGLVLEGSNKYKDLSFFRKRYQNLSSQSRNSVSFVKDTKVSCASEISKDIS